MSFALCAEPLVLTFEKPKLPEQAGRLTHTSSLFPSSLWFLFHIGHKRHLNDSFISRQQYEFLYKSHTHGVSCQYIMSSPDKAPERKNKPQLWWRPSFSHAEIGVDGVGHRGFRSPYHGGGDRSSQSPRRDDANGSFPSPLGGDEDVKPVDEN